MTRCFVYWNLHRHCFSVKSLATGLVIAHADSVTLRNVTFKVSEAGRQRVLREKRKNVHAGVVGDVVDMQQQTQLDMFARRVSYNPYRSSSFFYVDDETPVSSADVVQMVNINKRGHIYT